MLLLSKQDIASIFSMKNAIDSDKTAFKLFSENKSVVPLRTNIDIPKFSGQSLYMPAYVQEIDSIGIKIVSYFQRMLIRAYLQLVGKDDTNGWKLVKSLA